MCAADQNKGEVRRLKGALENWGREGKSSTKFHARSQLVRRDFATKLKSKEIPGVTLRFRVRGPIKTAHIVGGEQMIN